MTDKNLKGRILLQMYQIMGHLVKQHFIADGVPEFEIKFTLYFDNFLPNNLICYNFNYF
jgi:hypothetical protein